MQATSLLLQIGRQNTGRRDYQHRTVRRNNVDVNITSNWYSIYRNGYRFLTKLALEFLDKAGYGGLVHVILVHGSLTEKDCCVVQASPS